VSAVVQVITSLERGGAQRVALETAASLHRKDRPQLLVTGAPAALELEARARLGRRLLHSRHLANPPGPLQDVACVVELHRLFARLLEQLGAPLVVHTHSSKAGVLGRLAAAALPGVRVVHTTHGFGTEALGARWRPLLQSAERLAGAATEVVVYVSDADRERARQEGVAPRSRALVIRAGVFTLPLASPTARCQARAALGIGGDAPLAVTVANMKPQKDPLFHLEVLAAWRRREPRARLLFVGDGPLRDAMKARARALGVEGALHLPGFLEDPRPAYEAGDVFLLASLWEGLPCAVLEALAAGLPAVVRDDGWAADLAFTPRVLRHGLDVDARTVAADLERARALGIEEVRLPRRFTLPGMLEDLDSLYDELLSSSAASARSTSSSVL
jgi:glycosyltransferase involved in cell wall biosynthesis